MVWPWRVIAPTELLSQLGAADAALHDAASCTRVCFGRNRSMQQQHTVTVAAANRCPCGTSGPACSCVKLAWHAWFLVKHVVSQSTYCGTAHTSVTECGHTSGQTPERQEWDWVACYVCYGRLVKITAQHA
jgi:hypothetical protein